MSRIERFSRNLAGRDVVVGDIHGHFTRLRQALAMTGFDPGTDRLFSVGDLVDRGPESESALEWLEQPWFHAARGNHEDIAIRYAKGDPIDKGLYGESGGGWFLALQADRQHEFARVFAGMPIAIEVETAEGPVGIVHADCPFGSWRVLSASLEALPAGILNRIEEMCMWSRRRIQKKDRSGVQGVRAVVVGHTPLRNAVVLGNVHHIDTRGWQPDGHFTLLDLDTLQIVPAAQPAPDPGSDDA